MRLVHEKCQKENCVEDSCYMECWKRFSPAQSASRQQSQRSRTIANSGSPLKQDHFRQDQQQYSSGKIARQSELSSQAMPSSEKGSRHTKSNHRRASDSVHSNNQSVVRTQQLESEGSATKLRIIGSEKASGMHKSLGNDKSDLKQGQFPIQDYEVISVSDDSQNNNRQQQLAPSRKRGRLSKDPQSRGFYPSKRPKLSTTDYQDSNRPESRATEPQGKRPRKHKKQKSTQNSSSVANRVGKVREYKQFFTMGTNTTTQQPDSQQKTRRRQCPSKAPKHQSLVQLRDKKASQDGATFSALMRKMFGPNNNVTFNKISESGETLIVEAQMRTDSPVLLYSFNGTWKHVQIQEVEPNSPDVVMQNNIKVKLDTGHVLEQVDGRWAVHMQTNFDVLAIKKRAGLTNLRLNIQV